MHKTGMLCAALVLCANSQAATIAAWSMDGQPGSQAGMAATDAAMGINAATLARGADLGAPGGSASFSSNGWGGSDSGDYLSFSISVESGYSLQLASLEIATRASNTGPGTLGLFYSLDGFSDPLDTFAQPGSDVVESLFDLSSLAVITGSIEFRIMEIGDTQADGSGSTSDAGTLRIVDRAAGATQFTGELQLQAVPLPASAWLFASALGAVGWRRRRADTRAVTGVDTDSGGGVDAGEVRGASAG
ncbi:hypothetical protein E4634_14305 [Mangrovimicrobium sediminis]|uniref:PEP-CTERM sorting domain-containing protein n=1 Tax=Mangrovimicrobium sediminis TaxID=2562682 RepID=A0A4Z0LZJ1_9GAMM|nr:hypothetical protein [Haliea sp. SAOS-164]TGD72689.1 hypothetical protein E4634_14305 [Haliea sp. SAOS-164]